MDRGIFAIGFNTMIVTSILRNAQIARGDLSSSLMEEGLTIFHWLSNESPGVWWPVGFFRSPVVSNRTTEKKILKNCALHCWSKRPNDVNV